MNEEYEEMNIFDPGVSILDPGISMLQSLEEGPIDEKCRACTRHLLDFKYNLLETSELFQLFVRLSTTQFDPDDLLPKSICPDCFQRLQVVDNFQKTCIESYTLLLEHITNNLKQESSGSIDLIEISEDSASNQSRLLEFEEVFVPDIKSDDIKTEDIKCEYQFHSDSEDETDKTIKANREKTLFDEIYLSLQKTMASKSSRKKRYSCQQCSRQYASMSLLRYHIHNQHSIKQQLEYACTIDGCDKKYRSQQARNHHVKNHSMKKVMCETCGKSFSGRTIREHRMLHKGQTPYACDQCPKKFPSTGRLEQHKLIHLNSKRYSCPICGIRMRSKWNMDGHMNIHTRERKFPCEQCDSFFFTKSNLLRHVRSVHVGIKDFNCTYCNKSFGQFITLQRHLMIHTGEKPYKCPYCDEGFIQKCRMVEHARNHEAKGHEPIKNTATEVDEG